MNFHYVLSTDPQYCSILQFKVNGRYCVEYKYNLMQSKSIAEVQMGSPAFPFTYVHSREVSLFTDYTRLNCLLRDTAYY